MQRSPRWLNGLLVAAIITLAVVLSVDFGARTTAYFGRVSFGLSEPPTPSLGERGSDPQTHARETDQQAGKETSGTEGNPFVVKIAPSPEAQPETPDQREGRQAKATEDHLGVVFSGIAAFATVLLVFVTGGLWFATYRLWRGTLRAIKGEEKAAKAMSDLATTADQTAERQLRAYVHVRDFPTNPYTASSAVRGGWVNAGATPTRKMVICVSWKYFKTDIPDDFDFPDLSAKETVVLGPGLSYDSTPMHVRWDIINEATNGIGHAYIWGWADYNDVFPKTRRHRTEFCCEMAFSRNPMGGTMLRFVPYKKHYAADDDCLREPSAAPE